MECYHKYYIHNFKFKSCSEFDESIFLKGKSIYEVIRIEKGVPLFLEDHLSRLYYSSELLNYTINESYCDIETLITEVIKKNQVNEGKIKLVIRFEDGNNEKDILLYYTPHYFPTEEEYNKGVKVGLCNVTRLNPNAKLLNSEARKRANNRIVEEKIFEVLLINKEGNITEGSRSNIFFIKDGKIITPPEQYVLNGITRKIILKICKENNIEIIEQIVNISELKNIDSVFLSGTSINALPVAQIEKIHFNTKDSTLNKIIELYNKAVTDYFTKTNPTS